MLAQELNVAQATAFLVLLRSKKETAEEMLGLFQGLKKAMIPVLTAHRVLDIVGTGGDGANTINISTGSAILAASCGVKIAKHGNRAVSSQAGSADVLQALGVTIDVTPAQVSASIHHLGLGFCFAPYFHPAFQTLRALRKALNVPTTLNILAPLLNPASPQHVILGVFDEALMRPAAALLQQSGTDRSMVVHGSGLDEISCVGPVKIIEVTQQSIQEKVFDPLDFGLPRCSVADLKGGSAADNARVLVEIFSGQHEQYRAIANTLIANAGVALYLYGIETCIADGIRHARENLSQGHALRQLERLQEYRHAD
jgi:anthranilate phosphoribosyltransferase